MGKQPEWIEDIGELMPLLTSLVSETWIAGQDYNQTAVQKKYDEWLEKNKEKIQRLDAEIKATKIGDFNIMIVKVGDKITAGITS